MNDFFNFEDWFTTKYKDKSSHRFFTFKSALGLLSQQGGKNIVETGTTRQVDDWGGGMSTVLFGDFAKHYDCRVWTCDIEPEAMDVCQKVTEEFKDYISYQIADSLFFLEHFKENIDLLYLDSMDCPEYDSPGTERLEKSQKHQLKELILALPKLNKGGVVLLDDNWFSNGGKCKLSKEFLEVNGWTCILDFQQSLWIKIC